MGIVSSVGLGSGIDIQSLVTQLAQAETQPALNAISRQKSVASTTLSGLGTLKSALSGFQTAVAGLKDGSLFKTHKTSSSDESIVKASAGANSVAGSYAVEVTQLAKAQKSIATSEFSNFSALVGGGTLAFETGAGESFSVTVGNTTTLSGLRDAINSATGNSVVTASIVNVDHVSTGPNDPENGSTVSKLVLTAKKTGGENAFTVSGSENVDAPGLSRFFSANLNAQTLALDAIISVDGQTATRSSNSMTDVLTGVTLDLQNVSEGTTVNIDVSLDNDAINTAVNGFVAAYNKLSSTTKSLGKYGGSTDGTGNGALIGDSTLRSISSQLRQNLTNTVSSATSNYNSLAMIGLSIKDGVMSLDSAKLNTALSTDLQSVSDIFSSTDGVANRTSDRLSYFLQSGGPLDSRQSTLTKKIADFDDRKLDIQERQSNVQAMLLKQFTAMDVTVGTFNSTGSFLTNWINSL
ncbi:flagellar hook protein [Methylomonas lenta]|uniref:Flagellar hook-associated protein 2 n=1 Tax=Methylomonas lenta TaxID=980561 RepID=A0A177NT02_9GAMM|nr:flagellar filament capping protein FliD [Methylomonas lenta]OAI21041.1 flagellar hook protein [Methylomonas lenta]